MRATAVVVWGALVGATAVQALAAPTEPPPPLPGGIAPAPPGSVATGFLPPRQKIEKPYTNDKCLKNCHELPGLGAGSHAGAVRNLHVDLKAFTFSTHGQKGIECVDCHQDADPNVHPRTGYKKVDCRACHAEKPPEGVFPVDALERLAEKGIKPPPKESRNGEGWMKTAHAKSWAEGNPAAPFCADCHTPHYMRKSKDPASTVHRANLPQTCGRCHPDQVKEYDVGGLLARFRISGHGKGGLAERYEISQCVSCHQGEAAHGEETITKQACPSCHLVPPKEDRERGGAVLASLHIRPLAADQPLARALYWTYTLVFWGAVALVVLFAVFMGFSTLYQKDEGEGGERKG